MLDKCELEPKEKQDVSLVNDGLIDLSKKVDISNIYIWKIGGEKSIVVLHERAVPRTLYSMIFFDSTLTDVFTNEEVYKDRSMYRIPRSQYAWGETLDDGDYALLYPISEVDKTLLVYPDQMVPLYALKQLYDEINKDDQNVLKRKK